MRRSMILLGLVLAAAPAQAIDKGVMDELILQCESCHGIDGQSVAAEVPALAGKSEKYLKTQIQNFQSGKREHEIMYIMGRRLSPEETNAIARYYSRIPRQPR